MLCLEVVDLKDLRKDVVGADMRNLNTYKEDNLIHSNGVLGGGENDDNVLMCLVIFLFQLTWSVLMVKIFDSVLV